MTLSKRQGTLSQVMVFGFNLHRQDAATAGAKAHASGWGLAYLGCPSPVISTPGSTKRTMERFAQSIVRKNQESGG